jgi:tetratricopeptide (TPR) repeat protein
MDRKAELARIQALHAKDQDAEALAACEALAASLGKDAPEAERADVLWQLADLRSHAEDHAGALAAYGEALPLLDRLGRRREGAITANNVAYHHAVSGRRPEALAALRDARERYRGLAKQPYLLRAYVNLGYWHLEWGELAEAESDFRAATQQARAWGDAGELGTCLCYLGRTLARAGRPDRALLAYTEAVPLLRKAGRPMGEEAAAELRALSAVEGGAR